MTWKRLVPEPTRSSGRRSDKPTARLGENGMLSLNVATVKMLGEPERVLVDVDTSANAIRLTPTTPTDVGGWTVSGGGNTTYRIRLAAFIDKNPQFASEYTVAKHQSAVVLRRKPDDE